MEEFVVGFKLNHRFNHLVAGNFTLEGTGAAVILGALLLESPCAVFAGLILALIGALLLFADLGNPLKSWRSIIKPGRSWISRGAIFLIGLTVFSCLVMLSHSPPPSAFASFYQMTAAVFAVLVMLYTGFLISSMKAVPFWNSPVIPLLFGLHSLSSGSLFLHFFALGGQVRPDVLPFLTCLEIALLSGAFIMTSAYVFYMSKIDGAPVESVRILIKGNMRYVFIAAAFIGGVLVPLILLIAISGMTESDSTAARLLVGAALIFRLAGDFSFRLSVLRTGVYEPVLI